jgi:hypothetical protein
VKPEREQISRRTIRLPHLRYRTVIGSIGVIAAERPIWETVPLLIATATAPPLCALIGFENGAALALSLLPESGAGRAGARGVVGTAFAAGHSFAVFTARARSARNPNRLSSSSAEGRVDRALCGISDETALGRRESIEPGLLAATLAGDGWWTRHPRNVQ